MPSNVWVSLPKRGANPWPSGSTARTLQQLERGTLELVQPSTQIPTNSSTLVNDQYSLAETSDSNGFQTTVRTVAGYQQAGGAPQEALAPDQGRPAGMRNVLQPEGQTSKADSVETSPGPR